jgi:hypothetical protein
MVARRHVDDRGADCEPGVDQDIGRRLRVLDTQVGE